MSKVKTSKEANAPLPLATILQSAIFVGNQEYVPELPNREKKLRIFKSQVLIMYSIAGKTHALMGPMSDPIVDIVKLRELFPSYHQSKPIVSIKKPIDLKYMTTTLCVSVLLLPSK